MVIVMKNNNNTLLLLSVTILFVFIAIANTQLLSLSPKTVYSTTQQQEGETSENNADTSGVNEEAVISEENTD